MRIDTCAGWCPDGTRINGVLTARRACDNVRQEIIVLTQIKERCRLYSGLLTCLLSADRQMSAKMSVSAGRMQPVFLIRH